MLDESLLAPESAARCLLTDFTPIAYNSTFLWASCAYAVEAASWPMRHGCARRCLVMTASRFALSHPKGYDDAQGHVGAAVDSGSWAGHNLGLGMESS